MLIRAFGAGRVPANAPGKMANAASSDLRRALGGAVALQKDVISETAATAMGDGAGIIIVAETDTGCVLGECAVPAVPCCVMQMGMRLGLREGGHRQGHVQCAVGGALKRVAAWLEARRECRRVELCGVHWGASVHDWGVMLGCVWALLNGPPSSFLIIILPLKFGPPDHALGLRAPATSAPL